MTASDRRVLLTKWVATAVHTVDSRAGCRFCLFAKTGSLMTTDGTGDARINPEGVTEPLAFMDDASYNEVARARGGE